MDRNVLNKIIESQDRGISIVDIRTGFAKTYTTVEHMVFDRIERVSRYVFVTNKKNNLPMKTIEEQYEVFGKSPKDEVLLVESYFDAIIHRLPKVNIPKRFQDNTYEALQKAVEEYLETFSDGDSQDSYKRDNAINRIKGNPANPEDYGLEKQFRIKVKNWLSDFFKDEKMTKNEAKQKKYNLIKNNPDYQWMGELYPEFKISEFKVLLMTTNKFIASYDTIIGGNESFLQSELIEDSIIIFDEFDQTKKVILQEIIDRTIEQNYDYLKVFAGFHRVLFRSSPSKIIRAGEDEYTKKLFDELQIEYQELSKKYLPDNNWRLDQDEGKRNLIYFNGDYTNFLEDEAENRLYCHFDEGLNEVSMEVLPRESFDTRKKDAIEPLEMIYDLSSFFNKIRFYFMGVANNLKKIHDKGDKDTNISLSSEDAFLSILNGYRLNSEEKSLLSSNFLQQPYKTKLSGGRKIHNQFYENGLLLLSFTNRINDIANTQFDFYKVSETPERIMLYLAEKAHVIGLSATAGIKSNLSNYDITFFQRYLGSNYQLASEKFTHELESLYQRMDQAYTESNVPITIDIFESVSLLLNEQGYNTPEEIVTILSAILKLRSGIKGREKIRSLADCLFNYSFNSEDQAVNPFVIRRYLEIVHTFVRFIDNNEIDSFLGLLMKIPKRNDSALDLQLLEKIFETIVTDRGSKAKLKILRGQNFEKEKERILTRLGHGEKIYVLSTYQTMGDGQNLQYRPFSQKGIIQIVPDREISHGDTRAKFKDFDGLYLGEITYVTQNLSENFFNLETLLKYLIEIEYISKAEELTPEQRKGMTKAGLQKYVSGKVDQWDRKAWRRLRDTLCGRRKVLQQVMQAVGRLTRTYLKKQIELFVNPSLLSALPLVDLEELKARYLLGDEMKLILSEAEKRQTKMNDVNLKEIQCAVRTDDFHYYRNRVLREIKDDNLQNQSQIKVEGDAVFRSEGEKMYEEVRNAILVAPTIRSDSELVVFDSIYQNFYIPISDKPRYVAKYDRDAEQYVFKLESSLSDLKNEPDWATAFEVSYETSALFKCFKYPRFKEYYVSQGYATYFGDGDLMINPIMLKDFFNPAVSELAGKFILEDNLGYQLSRYDEPGYFEYFDYQLVLRSGKKVLVDFKIWLESFDVVADQELEKIYGKLQETDADLAMIINVISSSEDFRVTEAADGKIIVIPGLIDKDGKVHQKYLKKIGDYIEGIH